MFIVILLESFDYTRRRNENTKKEEKKKLYFTWKILFHTNFKFIFVPMQNQVPIEFKLSAKRDH